MVLAPTAFDKSMSAIPSWAAPPEPPDPPSVRPTLRPAIQRELWIAGVSILILLAASAAWLFRSREQERQMVPRSARSKPSWLDRQTRRIAGSIFPGRFANIAAPVLQSPDAGRGLVLIYLADNGKVVKERRDCRPHRCTVGDRPFGRGGIEYHAGGSRYPPPQGSVFRARPSTCTSGFAPRRENWKKRFRMRAWHR